MSTPSWEDLHRALFRALIPDAALAPAEEKILEAIRATPSLRGLLQAALPVFADGLADPASVLKALSRSEDNAARRLARTLKAAYYQLVYQGELAERLTGVKSPKMVRDDLPRFVEHHRPRWAPSPLRLDPATGEIRHGEHTFDYLIVGSGPAGSVLAHELRQSGCRVALLEKGPFLIPGARETKSHPQLMESGGMRLSDDGGLMVYAGEAAGGGSTVNWNLAFPPSLPYIQERLNRWERAGLIGPWTNDNAWEWSAENVARASRYVGEQLGTRQIDPEEINANNRVLWDGAQALGIQPALYQVNSAREADHPDAVTVKLAAAEKWLLPALRDPRNFSFLPNIDVQRLCFDGKPGEDRTAVAVEAVVGADWPEADGISLEEMHGLGLRPGQKVSFRARNVIVCAGSLGTPALLSRSGLKESLPRLGEGLVTHPIVPVFGLFPERIGTLDGTAASVFVDSYFLSHDLILESGSFTFTGLASQVFALEPDVVRELFANFDRLAIVVAVALENSDLARPDFGSRVYLDANGNVQVRFALRDEDRKNLAFGVAQSARILFEAGARKVFLPTDEIDPCLGSIDETSTLAERLRFLPNRTALVGAQLQSTCRFGKTPQDGVVGPDHRVHGTSNVFVMDSSVFPGTVGANPQQSVYALAKLFADRLLESRR